MKIQKFVSDYKFNFGHLRMQQTFTVLGNVLNNNLLKRVHVEDKCFDNIKHEMCNFHEDYTRLPSAVS